MSTEPKMCSCGHNENRHEPGFIKACLMPGCGCKDFEPGEEQVITADQVGKIEDIL